MQYTVTHLHVPKHLWQANRACCSWLHSTVSCTTSITWGAAARHQRHCPGSHLQLLTLKLPLLLCPCRSPCVAVQLLQGVITSPLSLHQPLSGSKASSAAHLTCWFNHKKPHSRQALSSPIHNVKVNNSCQGQGGKASAVLCNGLSQQLDAQHIRLICRCRHPALTALPHTNVWHCKPPPSASSLSSIITLKAAASPASAPPTATAAADTGECTPPLHRHSSCRTVLSSPARDALSRVSRWTVSLSSVN